MKRLLNIIAASMLVVTATPTHITAEKDVQWIAAWEKEQKEIKEKHAIWFNDYVVRTSRELYPFTATSSTILGAFVSIVSLSLDTGLFNALSIGGLIASLHFETFLYEQWRFYDRMLNIDGSLKTDDEKACPIVKREFKSELAVCHSILGIAALRLCYSLGTKLFF